MVKGAVNPAMDAVNYPKPPAGLDTGLDLGPKTSGEENPGADQISAAAQDCARAEGYDEPNAEDPTSQGAGGEPKGNRK